MSATATITARLWRRRPSELPQMRAADVRVAADLSSDARRGLRSADAGLLGLRSSGKSSSRPQRQRASPVSITFYGNPIRASNDARGSLLQVSYSARFQSRRGRRLSGNDSTARGPSMRKSETVLKLPPVTLHSWPCPKCSQGMRLAYIIPQGLGYELRTFECVGCGHENTVLRQV